MDFSWSPSLFPAQAAGPSNSPGRLRPYEFQASEVERGWVENAGHRSTEQTLRSYSAVSLAEVSNSLLTRTDTKFLLSLETLLAMLPELAKDYAVLDIAGHRLFDYHNLYLDSRDFAFFRAHHRGAYARHKLRYRHYQQTNDTFLELKTKDATRQTVKLRERLRDVSDTGGQVQMLEAARRSIAAPPLVAKLRGRYKRISLVNKDSDERLTLDFDLQFSLPVSDDHVHLGNVAIAELKQPRRDAQSPFMQQAKHHRLQETSISKYCVGCCYLYAHLKHNHFRPLLRKLDRLGE